jgi:FAD/FMN-containing dehydrogenase
MVDILDTRIGFSTFGVDNAAVKKLKASLRGQLILPEDNAYGTARKVWNAEVDKYPALIARTTGPDDVLRTVDFANRYDLPLSVRGGGHNPSGAAVVNGGVVIDLSRMRQVNVISNKRIAIAEGGATWGELDRATQAHGLAATGTDISTVGIGGSTLGGGQGWLGRKIGLAIDNLLSVDIVTADGQLLRASEDENADLFWAVRGAGSNFGVVTSLKYRLHPVGPTVIGGLVIHPMSRAKEVLRFYREFTSTASEELTTVAIFMTLPDGQPIIAIGVNYAGDLGTGLAEVMPLRRFGSPVADLIGPMPYLQVQTGSDEHAPFGLHSYWKAGLLDEMSEDFIEALTEKFASMPSPYSIGFLWHLGGAISRVAPDATAYYHRNAQYHSRIISVWADPAEAQKNIQWGQETFAAVKRHFNGKVYVNHMDHDDTNEERVREAYGANYERLVSLKSRYDSTNLFSSNFNIRPTL